MPPRGSSEGLDFTPILTHYLFLSTSLVAIIGWLVAFIGQIAVNIRFDHGAVGELWFAIWLQLFLILGVLYTLASDSIAMHRFQIATFGAVAIVFAVGGVNRGIFSGAPAPLAMSAGWLLLAMVDIIWVLYFTSEEDSLSLHIFNSLGTGGLSGPGRRRTRGGRAPSMVMGGGVGSGGMGNGGYGSPYGNGAGGYDPKLAPTTMGMGMGMGGGAPVMSGTTGSFSGPGSAADARSMRSMNRPISDASAPVMHSPQLGGVGELGPGPGSPLMGSGNAGVGAGGGPSLTNVSSPQDNGPDSAQVYQAKALYAYTASPDDANEISFVKGEIMEILDKSGKWWQAKKSDGRIGIAPSNYLQII